jgi:3-hydroxyacyl-CoA dehydrogenase
MCLVDEGASPQQIDKALVSWGLAMGPFAMGDLAGNDVSWLVRKHRAKLGKNYTPNPLADQLCEMGRFGQKTGKGWYRYETGNRTPLVDPEVENMIQSHREKIGVKSRLVGDEEIIERCIFAMANEGARIVEEGIALRPSDVDAVYLNGYGFPTHRGGPMFYADSVGLSEVIGKIDAWMKGYGGTTWVPSNLLRGLAEQGKKFNDV